MFLNNQISDEVVQGEHIPLGILGATVASVAGADKTIKNNPYQGPVPQGNDAKHFRKTGETIPLGDKE